MEGTMRALKLTALALLLALPGAGAAAPTRPVPLSGPADVAAAIAAPGRPADQVKLDAVRKPVEVLRFEGLKRGDIVLDLFAGGGYYSEIMAKAVGPRGGVLAWEPAGFLSDKAKAGWKDLRTRAPNVGLIMVSSSAFTLPRDAFDFVMFHLNYHDVYWQNAKYGYGPLDPNAFLRTVYDSMKPGATIAVIDHVGPAGDTRAIVEKLHRIDPATIKADFKRAGFVLDGESNLLRNPADDHSKLVFDPSIRGVTDRVVYRFRKRR
jgi:predicted methyltransferase